MVAHNPLKKANEVLGWLHAGSLLHEVSPNSTYLRGRREMYCIISLECRVNFTGVISLPQMASLWLINLINGGLLTTYKQGWSSKYSLQKTKMTMRKKGSHGPWMKMYLLRKLGDFPSDRHVTFPESSFCFDCLELGVLEFCAGVDSSNCAVAPRWHETGPMLVMLR